MGDILSDEDIRRLLEDVFGDNDGLLNENDPDAPFRGNNNQPDYEV